MADGPGRRHLPFSLSIRQSAQITNQNHPGDRQKRQIRRPTSPGPSWLACYINDVPFWIPYTLETENGQISIIPLNELDEMWVYDIVIKDKDKLSLLEMKIRLKFL